jgi:hypothetical protein
VDLVSKQKKQFGCFSAATRYELPVFLGRSLDRRRRRGHHEEMSFGHEYYNMKNSQRIFLSLYSSCHF